MFLIVILLACNIFTSSAASEDVEPTWQVQIANAREIMDPHNHDYFRRLNVDETNKKTESRKTRQLQPSKGNSSKGKTPIPTPMPTPVPTVSPTTPAPTASPTATDAPNDTFTSFFELELETRDGISPTELELNAALRLFVQSYNDLKSSSFEDPFERTMVEAELVSMTLPQQRRRLKGDKADAADGSHRQLQNLNLLVFLRVSGICRGCQSNRFFTNQVVGRRRRQQRKLFDPPISSIRQAGVPSATETLNAFSQQLQASQNEVGSIVDALSLTELLSLPTPAPTMMPTIGKSKGKGKGSKKSKGKGGKGGGGKSKGKGSSMRLTSPPMQASGASRVSVSSVTTSLPLVQIQMAAQQDNKCMSYTTTNGSGSSITVEACSSEEENANGHWQVIAAASNNGSSFQLRHKNSQLCLPTNPDAPGENFDCFVGSKNDAQAHRITGLVDCAGPNVATLGFTDSYDHTALYLQECASGSSPGADSDIILMSYNNDDDGKVVAVWGEKIMLDLEGIVSNRGMQGSWTLKEL